MSIYNIILLLIIGICSGILSGLFGIGGAVLVIPALVFGVGLSQHDAQGTSLGMLLFPIGIFAVINYSKQGYINWKFAIILALSFVVGAYVGSQLSLKISDKILQKAFGFFLLLLALRMIFNK